MMLLQTLLGDNPKVSPTLAVTGLSVDSRSISSDQVFFAVAPLHQSALPYVKQALSKGVSVILYDPQDMALSDWITDMQQAPSSCTFIAINDLAAQIGIIAARYYSQPSKSLDIIGITGTNGKTSCSQFLGQLLDNCGIIGTLGWGTWEALTYTGYTTPDALATQSILAQFVKQRLHSVAMEVSSHGLAEGRVNGIGFKGVMLTNISRDHLDYHGSMSAYIETKQRLFSDYDSDFAVLNLDDALSTKIVAAIPESVAIWGFRLENEAPGITVSRVPLTQIVSAHHISHKVEGLAFTLCWRTQEYAVQVPLYGGFNVENILAVVTVMLALGYTLTAIVDKLQRLKPIPGRMQRFGENHSALIFVDYAHTPDALEKALISARQHCKQKLWVVFGCGGDRDTGKRPQMGACAERYADYVIITDDNPRSENPATITENILSGCTPASLKPPTITIVIHDRAQAIQTALQQASKDDCIVIAGKGHETYQEIAGKKHPFSDAQVVVNYLEKSRSLAYP